MAAGSWAVEVETQVSASRLFNAALHDWHNLGPKVLPHVLASASVLEGEGGPGSVRQLNFVQTAMCMIAGLPFPFVKERLDFIDRENFEVKTTLVGGGPLGTELESATSHFKITPTAGGSVLKLVSNYKLVAGVEDSEEKIAKAKEGVTGSVKAAEGYLLANPDAYV